MSKQEKSPNQEPQNSLNLSLQKKEAVTLQTEEAEKALRKAAEEALNAAIDLVKDRITQPGERGSSNKGAKEAMTISTDLVKQEITLAMGAIVFSGTLLKATTTGSYLQWLFFSWGAWGLSLIIGLLVMGRVAILTKQEQYDIEDKGLMWLGMIQQLLLVGGVIFFAVFVVAG